jgi:hypothetical protein
MKPMLTTDFQEAVRAGPDGITWDLEILTRPWGFQLNVIAADVFLWHGENDTQAPLAMGKRLASALPHCRATFFPGEGHWAIYSHWQEILTALARAEAPARAEPQHATIAIVSSDANSAAPLAVLPLDSGIEIMDIPADSSQGLQPAREVASAITMVEETPPAVTPEPEPVREAPKTTSKKTSKRRTAAVAKTPAVAPEPEPVQDAPKPIAKKTAKRSTKAVAETPAVVAAKPQPVQDAPKPVAKKTAKRSTAAAAGPTGQASAKREPARETAEAGKPKHLLERAKAAPKTMAKPKLAVAKPSPVVVPEGPDSQAEPSEPTSARPSSRRKAAREAVLV